MSFIGFVQKGKFALRPGVILGLSVWLIAGSLAVVLHPVNSTGDTAGMVLLSGGAFQMGSSAPSPDHHMNHRQRTNGVQEPSHGFYFNNVGFRCAKDAQPR